MAKTKTVTFNSAKSANSFASKTGGQVSSRGSEGNQKHDVTFSKSSSSRNSNIQQPSIRPSGTSGSEWDDFAWGADDI